MVWRNDREHGFSYKVLQHAEMFGACGKNSTLLSSKDTIHFLLIDVYHFYVPSFVHVSVFDAGNG